MQRATYDIARRPVARVPPETVSFDAADVMVGGAETVTLRAVLVFVASAALIACGVAGERPEVLGYTDTVWLDRQGPLKGLITTVGAGDHRLDQVEVYLGVPYAASRERFMPPGDSPTWCPKADDGSFNRSHCRPLRAEYLRPVCPQRPPEPLVANTNKRLSAVRQNYLKRLAPYLGNQSEDCLFLNIYAPHGKRWTAGDAAPHWATYCCNPLPGIYFSFKLNQLLLLGTHILLTFSDLDYNVVYHQSK